MNHKHMVAIQDMLQFPGARWMPVEFALVYRYQEKWMFWDVDKWDTCKEEPHPSLLQWIRLPDSSGINEPVMGEVLNRIIIDSLGGPGGEPDQHHHLAAAGAYRALKLLGLAVRDEATLVKTLSDATGPEGNLYSTDFLAEVGYEP
jgi:hypothetical protein